MLSRHFKNHRIKRFAMAGLAALALARGEGLSAQIPGGTPVSCPFSHVLGASFADGFYILGYTGNNLWRVTLGYSTTAAGPYALSLTARRNSYDGPLLGTQTAISNLTAAGETLVTFDFGGVPVSPGDTITFTQDVSPLGLTSGEVFYDQGDTTCAFLFETTGAPPPLGTVSREGVGITIEQLALNVFSCIASDTVLCIDDTPGDHRFQVTATFNTAQGGGRSGTAQAIPLTHLGVTHGGLFWFFGADNPEILFKVINGCALNDHYWTFLSADTNVGFSLTVSDTFLANRSSTYTHADNTPAAPIQDTLALSSCHSCSTDSDCPTGRLCCFIPADLRACLAPLTGTTTCPLFP